MSKVLGWAAFGVAVRWWQLGMEMRPFFARETILQYPLYAAVTGSFGYWLTGVEQRQTALLRRRRDLLLEKRRRHALADEADGAPTVVA